MSSFLQSIMMTMTERNKTMDIKYVITYYNKWKRPYYYSEDDRICVNTESSQYETTDKDLALRIAKDFLDVPEAEMTLDEVRKEFEDHRCGEIPEEKLVAIQNYYNGRLALYEHVKTMFASEPWLKPSAGDAPQDGQTPDYTRWFDIPYEYNHFMVYDDGGNESKEVQLEAYLKVDVYIN